MYLYEVVVLVFEVYLENEVWVLMNQLMNLVFVEYLETEIDLLMENDVQSIFDDVMVQI
jgi:hypothetical protein